MMDLKKYFCFGIRQASKSPKRWYQNLPLTLLLILLNRQFVIEKKPPLNQILVHMCLQFTYLNLLSLDNVSSIFRHDRWHKCTPSAKTITWWIWRWGPKWRYGFYRLPRKSLWIGWFRFEANFIAESNWKGYFNFGNLSFHLHCIWAKPWKQLRADISIPQHRSR